MDSKLRYFSVDEAGALIPRIAQFFYEAQETKRLIETKIEEWRRIHKAMTPAETALFKGQVDFLATRLEEQLNQIGELGCLPKDLDLGLVDFPARVQGKEAYLCWRLGEDRITHWHGITEGYAGRKEIGQEDKVK